MNPAPCAGAPLPSCAANESLPATAWCTSCGQPFHGRFLDIRTDGRAICFSCLARDQVETLPREGDTPADPALDGGWIAIFRRVAIAPAHALSTRWDGALWPTIRLGLLWTLLGYVGSTGWTYLLRFDEVQVWLQESGATNVPEHLLPWIPWLGLPMAALVRFALGAFLLHFGLRLSTVDAGPFREHLRVYALSSVVLLLGVLPLLGSSLAVVAQFVVLLHWSRTRHQIGLFRAIFALGPWLFAALLLDVSGGV